MRLTDDQRRKLSDIFADIAQVALAGIVVPYITGVPDIRFAVLGLLLASVFWILSMRTSRLAP